MLCKLCNDTGYKKVANGKMLCENGCAVKDKHSTLTTALVTYFADGEAHTNIVNNFSITVVRKGKKGKMTLHTDKLKHMKLGKQHIHILVTRDPTPNIATGAVSLGFMRQRWYMKNANMIKKNPPTFKGEYGDYGTDILLEMWDYDNI